MYTKVHPLFMAYVCVYLMFAIALAFSFTSEILSKTPKAASFPALTVPPQV